MLKLISRQNMAVLATICIIGVLCNPDYFDSILDTYQGRIILVGFIILLSYENPVLGTIVVLFIAIKTTKGNEAFTTEDTYSAPLPTLKPSQEGFDVIGTENNITRGKPPGKTTQYHEPLFHAAKAHDTKNKVQRPAK